MVRLIQFILTLMTTFVRSRLSLQAENAALRNQLLLYRKSGQRPRIRPADRLLWCCIAKCWKGWRKVLYFVQPRTVINWQKKRFRDYWRALSLSSKAGRPQISPELRKLIGQMWEANPAWGSPRLSRHLRRHGKTPVWNKLLAPYAESFRPCHPAQRAASQETHVVVSGLLPSLANAPNLGWRRA
jgi:hypothetical protein